MFLLMLMLMLQVQDTAAVPDTRTVQHQLSPEMIARVEQALESQYSKNYLEFVLSIFILVGGLIGLATWIWKVRLKKVEMAQDLQTSNLENEARLEEAKLARKKETWQAESSIIMDIFKEYTKTNAEIQALLKCEIVAMRDSLQDTEKVMREVFTHIDALRRELRGYDKTIHGGMSRIYGRLEGKVAVTKDRGVDLSEAHMRTLIKDSVQ